MGQAGHRHSSNFWTHALEQEALLASAKQPGTYDANCGKNNRRYTDDDCEPRPPCLHCRKPCCRPTAQRSDVRVRSPNHELRCST